ncbi:GGDEF domain-containing protein [Thalassotalea fusca]
MLEKDANNNRELIYGIIVDVTEKEQHKLELKKQRQKFKKLSETDTLTKLYNRHYFMKAFEYEFSKAMRAHRSMAVIMLDIDFFKQYNDHYGHLQGDRCLYKVAKCLKRALERKIDIVARYGGEEFIAFVSDITQTQVTSIIDKLQVMIRASKIPHESSPNTNTLTVSIGAVIGFPTHKQSVGEEFIAAADSNLFKAKSAGRDCSIITAIDEQ